MEWTREDKDFLIDLVSQGELVLVADTGLGIPTIHGIPNAEHIWMGDFIAETPDFTIRFEGGGAMQRTPSGHGYSLASVSVGVFPYDHKAVIAKLQE